MSKTPFFSKERTPPSILIPHVDNKTLSYLSAPARRSYEGRRQLNPKGEPVTPTRSRRRSLTGDPVLWDLQFLLVVKAGARRRHPSQCSVGDITSGSRVAAVGLFKCNVFKLGSFKATWVHVFSAERRSPTAGPFTH